MNRSGSLKVSPKTWRNCGLAGVDTVAMELTGVYWIPLQGNWREEHLFALKQAMALYDGRDQRASNAKNAPQFDVEHWVY